MNPNQFNGTVEQHIENLYRMQSSGRIDGYKLHQRVAAMEAFMALQLECRKPSMPIEFKGQFGEDALIWDLTRGQTRGFFIEAGAYDGYNLSVTYGLEAIGWTGLLVEPIRERAEACASIRPGSRVVNAALGSTPAGTARFSVSSEQEGLLSMLDPGGSVEVPTTSLDYLLKDHEWPIDVAVIDVEGSEIDVLRGFNLNKHKPRILIVEDNTRGESRVLDDYMASQPYRLHQWLEVNRVYLRNDF